MDQMDKIWREVDSLKESRIRHDERISQVKQNTDRALGEIVRLEGDLNAKFEALTIEIREGFKIVGTRIDETESHKKMAEGYKEGQIDAIKKFSLWLGILTFAAGIIMWRISK